MKPNLTIDILLDEAREFAQAESIYPEPTLYGVTDGKAIGTYVEQKFKAYLAIKYTFVKGNSASGIDLPELGIDIKLPVLLSHSHPVHSNLQGKKYLD